MHNFQYTTLAVFFLGYNCKHLCLLYFLRKFKTTQKQKKMQIVGGL